MRVILSFFAVLLFMSFDMGAYAALNASGNSSSPACAGKDKAVTLTDRCPSVPQLKLLGNQSLKDNEFLYASYSTYESLQKEYNKRPAACRTYFSTNQANGVYECDKDYCGRYTVLIMDKNHGFNGKTVADKRAYICDTNVDDRWIPYSHNISECTKGQMDTKSYTKIKGLDGLQYRYKKDATRITSICQVPQDKSNVQQTGDNTVSKTGTQGATRSETKPDGETTEDKTPKKNTVEKPQPEQSTNKTQHENVGDEKIGQPCTTENAKKAVWQKIDKEIKCVAKECNQDRYLVVNSKGESQGYCIANTCKAPKTLNIIDGTKTDKRCVDPAASEIAEETIEEDVEEELPTVPFRPDLQINQPCAQGFLTILNAKTGKYAKHAGSDDIYCDITECNENFVKVSRNQGETYDDYNGVNLYEICECPSETHTINNEGKCVANTNGVPATDRTPAEANVSITVQGTINDSAGNCLANAEIVFPDGAYINQEGCNFTVGLQESGEITFSFDGYESVSKSYSESVYNEIIVLTKSATDVAVDEGNEAVVPDEGLEEQDKEPIDKEDDKIQELRDKADAAHERENSMANKMLGAAGIGATGIGGMMLMQGLSEQKADNNAQEQMRAYLSTFMCRFGDGRATGGESDIELPGANALLPLYAEYVTLANETKAMKTELDLKPGIESESILDNATSGLYDDENTGKTSGAFASLARALQNPDGEDAKKWAEQTEKASKNIKTGAITAGAGAVGGLVGHITESAVYKKKAEKGNEDSDDESEDKKYKPKKRGRS